MILKQWDSFLVWQVLGVAEEDLNQPCLIMAVNPIMVESLDTAESLFTVAKDLSKHLDQRSSLGVFHKPQYGQVVSKINNSLNKWKVQIFFGKPLDMNQ